MGERSRAKYIKGTPEERFWPKVDRDGPIAPLDPALGKCWLWLAGRVANGQPTFSLGSSKTVNARKWIYERDHGPLQPGLVIAAVCGTASCVNPTHIKALTKAEFHTFQAALVRSRGGRKRPELCRRGLHPLPAKGQCPPCTEERQARYNEAAKQNYTPRGECRFGHEYPEAETTPGQHRVCPTCLVNNAKFCSLDGCTEPHRFHGYCQLHGQRWKKVGSTAEPVPLTTEERFWAKVDRSGEHWLWIGGGSASAGSFRDTAAKRAISPRRWVWVNTQGPIPRGYKAWSTCGVDNCIRPDHAELMTIAEVQSRKAAARETCSKGHEWTLENTRITPGGVRVCRSCHRDKERSRHIAGTVGVEYVEILRGDPCSYCGAPSEHIDHIVPVTKGGESHWSNLTAACGPCNQSKNTHDLLQFLLKRLPA